ncbi:serum amyloid P-component-like [Amphiprion ocellaris]|uniref:Pentraxin family member n=1 Tax=Amphiprion ocellaris TaxID=80972 RepID=A0A3Q1C4K3_AMPOC|nr:serum amyloid P-component-like [Amphiprion ocellaris]
MVLLLLLVMLTSCAAIPQDLSDKMFTFPQETNTSHVRLTTSRQNLGAVSVCLRFFTDLKRAHSLFSLAAPSVFNDFLIFKRVASDEFEVWAKDRYAILYGQDYKLNTWHSVCSTWDAASGVMQFWLDGKPSSRKFVRSGSNINGPILIVLGQDQDSYGGGFDIKQSFVGMMADLHMWDYVISPCEIHSYSEQQIFTLGNVLDWSALEFQISGKVLIEDYKKTC